MKTKASVTFQQTDTTSFHTSHFIKSNSQHTAQLHTISGEDL